jgi:hypothetical protein
MNAMYFMGLRAGKSASTGEEYYAVNILWLNSFGSYELKQLYASPALFDEIKRMDLARGTAVDCCAMGKSIMGLTISRKFKPLNLGEVVK